MSWNLKKKILWSKINGIATLHDYPSY